EDQLGVRARDDAPDRVPRGLRPVAGDRDLAADQGVGQRRLAGVGTADEAGKAGAVRRGGRSFSRNRGLAHERTMLPSGRATMSFGTPTASSTSAPAGSSPSVTTAA